MEPKEKLFALSTYLKKAGLSQSKEATKKFEELVEADEIQTKIIKRYKLSTIESGIRQYNIEFREAVPRKDKPQKNTFVIKNQGESVMVKAKSIFSTPYSRNKVLAHFHGEDVFNTTKEFLSISLDIDEKAEVLDIRKPFFRSMMRMVSESKDNTIKK